MARTAVLHSSGITNSFIAVALHEGAQHGSGEEREQNAPWH